MYRSYWSSYCLWHEHPDGEQPSHWIVSSSPPAHVPLAKELADWPSSCVTFALLGAAIIPMAMLVNTTPDRIPTDVIAEQQDAARKKMEGA